MTTTTVNTAFVSVLDTIANKGLVINKIVSEFKTNVSVAHLSNAAESFVQRVLDGYEFLDLLSFDITAIRHRVRLALLDEIENNICPNYKGLTDNGKVILLRYISNNFSFTQMFDTIFGSGIDHLTLFEDTMNFLNDSEGIFEDNDAANIVSNDYVARVSVVFLDDYEDPETHIDARFGEHKIRRWSNCSLATITYLPSEGGHNVAMFECNIHGNSSYTPETIERAIRNRIGATAKRGADDNVLIKSVSVTKVAD